MQQRKGREKEKDGHEAGRVMRRPARERSPLVDHRSILADGMAPMTHMMSVVMLITPTIIAIPTLLAYRAAIVIPTRRQSAHPGATCSSGLPPPPTAATTTTSHHRHPPTTGDADGPETATGPSPAAARTIAGRKRRIIIPVRVLTSHGPVTPATSHIAMSSIVGDQRVRVPTRISTIANDARRAERGTMRSTGALIGARIGEANGYYRDQ